MYLRIIENTIYYPYDIITLRQSHPNVSFPENLTNEVLLEWGVYEVSSVIKPYDYTKNITEGTPNLIDDVYYQNWIQSNATEEEINYRIENQWEEVRVQRNQLLSDCDWTQLADVSDEIKANWTEYRQSLRDITSQSNPFNINWPVKP
jgi:hypothetical protein